MALVMLSWLFVEDKYSNEELRNKSYYKSLKCVSELATAELQLLRW